MPTVTNNTTGNVFPGTTTTLTYWLAVGLFLLGVQFDWPEWRLATKALPVLIMGIAVWQTMAASRIRLPLLAALLLCAAGDLLLEILWLAAAPPLPWFAMGLSAFLLAHLALLLAFIFLGVQWRLWAVVLLPWTFGLLLLLWPQLGPMRGPVTVYVSAITAMMMLAISVRNTETDRYYWWLLVVGAVIFGISDSVIAINRFLAPVPGARYWISITYWIAMFCIPIALVKLSAQHLPISRKASG